MHSAENTPTAERLLSTLIELYADQMGVKVAYELTTSDGVDDSVSDTPHGGLVPGCKA